VKRTELRFSLIAVNLCTKQIKLQGRRWEAKPRLIFRRKGERGKIADGDK
jgi:hypothetical protein